MKTLKLMSLVVMMFIASNSMHAQLSVSVNLGLQPSWGPAGYSSVNYYYLPDIQAYYDIRASQFIYLSGGTWIRSRNLPRQYRNYDLDRGYKVVLNDYHGSRPYTNFRNHKERYYRGYSKPQRTIGERDENRGDNNNHGNYENNGHNNNGGGNNDHNHGKR